MIKLLIKIMVTTLLFTQITLSSNASDTQSKNEVYAYAKELSNKYRIPLPVLLAKLSLETNNWSNEEVGVDKARDKDGNYIVDKNNKILVGSIGIGLSQITVFREDFKNDITYDEIGGLEDPIQLKKAKEILNDVFHKDLYKVVADNTGRVKCTNSVVNTTDLYDWKKNMELGVQHLLYKKNVDSGGINDPNEVIENWYIPLLYYNSVGKTNDPSSKARYSIDTLISDPGLYKDYLHFTYSERAFNVLSRRFKYVDERDNYFRECFNHFENLVLPGPIVLESYGYKTVLNDFSVKSGKLSSPIVFFSDNTYSTKIDGSDRKKLPDSHHVHVWKFDSNDVDASNNPIPVIVSPKNDEPAKNNVTLSWQNIDGAKSYYVEICNAAKATTKSGSNRYTNPIYTKMTSDNNLTVDMQLVPNNRYLWHVCVATSPNDAKDFSMDGAFHVTDDNEILNPPKPESPPNNSTIEIEGKKNNVTLKIKDYTNNQKAVAYEFEWSTSSIYWGWPLGSKAKTSSGKKEFSIEVSANKKYFWHARAFTANGTAGSWSEPIFQFEVKEKVVADCNANPPTNVTTKENCNVPKEIALYWTNPQTNQNCPSIREYKIETYENDKYNKQTTYKITDTIPYRMSGNNGSSYYFKISAIYNDGKISQIVQSNEIICGESCKECKEQPGEITNLNGTQQGKSIRFTWSEPRFVKPSCKTRFYKLRLSQDNKPFITLPDCQTETFEYSSNLVSGSSYVLEVKPVNSFGEGKATLSNTIKYSFDCTPTKPGKPSGSIDCSKKQIKFAWIPSAVDTSLGCGRVTKYKVIYMINDTPTEDYVTDQFYFVNNIKNGQQCKIMVTPVIDQDIYKEKASEWSDAIVFDCECDHPQPVNLRHSINTSPKEVIFEWDEPKPKKQGCAGPISYMVKYTFHYSNKNPINNGPLTTKNRMLRIPGERGVKYEFFVKAIYADGGDSDYARYDKLVEYSPECYFNVLPQPTVVYAKVGDTKEQYVNLTIDGKADTVSLEGYQEYDSLSTEFFEISLKVVKAPGTARLKIKPSAFTKARDYRILFKASGCQQEVRKLFVTLSVIGNAIVEPSPMITAEVTDKCTVRLTWKASPTNHVLYKVYRSKNTNFTEKVICLDTSYLFYEDSQPEKGVTYYYAVIAYDKTTNTESTATWSIPVVILANCGKQETCDVAITNFYPTTATKHPSNQIPFTVKTNVPVSSVEFTLYRPGGAKEVDQYYFDKVNDKEWTKKIIMNATGQWRFEFKIRCLNSNITTIDKFVIVDSDVPDCKDVPSKPGTPVGNPSYDVKKIRFEWKSAMVGNNCCPITNYFIKYTFNGLQKDSIIDVRTDVSYELLNLGATKGIYCLQVKAKNCNGESDWSDVGCFNYDPPEDPHKDCKPNAPTINEPKLDCQQKIVIFSWTKPATSSGCSEVNNYEISLSINGQSPSIYKKNALSEQFTDVTNGTEFNFKVRAISADGTSDYATKIFKVDCLSPNPNAQAPQLVKPAYKTILEDNRMPNNLVLEWKKPSNWNDTMEYIVEISKWDSTIGGLKQVFKLTFASVQDDVQIRPYDETNAITNTKGFNLEYDTKYYWHVASRFTAGNKTNAEWSSMWEFTTPSKTPALTAPGNSNQNYNAISFNGHGIAYRPFRINQFFNNAWKAMACPDNTSVANHFESGLCLQDFVSDKKRWRIG